MKMTHRRTRRLAIAALAVLAAGCKPASPRSGPAPAADPQEAAVYAAAIDQGLSDGGATVVVLAEQTETSHVEGEQARALAAEVDSAFPAAAVAADVAARNARRAPLPRTLPARAAVRLFSPEALFVPDGNLRAEYDTFRERYAPATSFHTLSRPGFDAERRHAMIVTGSHCGALCGHGQILLLERGADGWRVIGRRGTWVS